MLRKLHAEQLFDSGGNLADLVRLIETCAGYRPTSTEKLIRVVLPVRYASERDRAQWLRSRSLNTFLKTLNWVAYDLKMMDELTQMFGERETFHNHRKNMVQLLHSLCVEWDKEDETRLSFSPVSKVFRRSTSAERELGPQEHSGSSHGAAGCNGTALSADEEDDLIRMSSQRFFYNLYKSEAERSERHRNWCRIFLRWEEEERPIGEGD